MLQNWAEALVINVPHSFDRSQDSGVSAKYMTETALSKTKNIIISLLTNELLEQQFESLCPCKSG